MKKYLILFIITLVLLGITTRVYCYNSEVTEISGTKYFSAVKDALSKAETSITLVMFVIDMPSNKGNSKINQLVSELVKAKQRGVEVEVVLDQNIEKNITKIKSLKVYQYLKESGIKVSYDELIRCTHAKTIVIDNNLVILGSTNWTESSLDKNIETNVLIKSKELAKDILDYIKTIKLDTETEKFFDSSRPATAINLEFMQNPKFASFMIKTQDERAFDIYLFLLKNFNANPDAKIIIFYDVLAKYLGIYDGWTSADYRRQIIKSFRKLEQKYKLIKFEPHYAKEAQIILLDYKNSTQTYLIPKEHCFKLPDEYFDFSWNRNLSFTAKFCYLVTLAHPVIWSKSVDEIAKEFGNVSSYSIYKGIGELRRKQLLEVKYDQLGGKPYEQRMPKIHKRLPLYNSKERELSLKELEKKYGKQEYACAKKYAKIVFEENNPDVIEDIILNTKQYGAEVVSKAFDIVAEKNIDNPKRVYSYAKGIIENMSSRGVEDDVAIS